MPSEASNRPTVPAPKPLIEPKNSDDDSDHLHRQIIGYLGAVLPLLVWVVDRWRPTSGLVPDELESISDYYYSSGVGAFCGILAALVVFFFSYRGYRNAHRAWDLTAAWVAASAALLVIVFPTFPPIAALEPSWWHDWIGAVHVIAAGVLFTAFACFSLFLFPKSNVPRELREADKRARNAIHYVCGVGIVVCLIWAAVVGLSKESIFLPETLALEFFAISWLAKGKADKTAARLVKRGANIGRPGRLESSVHAGTAE